MVAFLKNKIRGLRNRLKTFGQSIPGFFKKYLPNQAIKHFAPRLLTQHLQKKRPRRDKPHFLILHYRYYSQNKNMGDSIEKFMLDGPLAASGLATYEVLYYDTDFAPFPLSDLQFLAKCDQIQPDAIILSSWWYECPPKLETLRVLREEWHIPIVAVWWDTCWKEFWPSVEPVLPLIDLNVVTDNPNLFFIEHNSPYFERFLPLWVPLDPKIYNHQNADRDLQVCFLGQVDGFRSKRSEYIQYLIDQKVPLSLSVTTRDKQPSHTEYVDTLKRSRIGLNFSYSVEKHVVKARVFETMLCGAMLMESENDQTTRYFVPMQDYVSFSSKEDLLQKLLYYLQHEDERSAIAARGEQKARQYYNHALFWRAVLDKLSQIQATPR